MSTTTSTPSLDIRPSTHPASADERARKMTNPGFGRVFTDHMVVIPYREGEGWGRGELKAYGPIAMDPASLPSPRPCRVYCGIKVGFAGAPGLPAGLVVGAGAAAGLGAINAAEMVTPSFSSKSTSPGVLGATRYACS